MRVAIAEDSALLRAGMARLLADEGIEVVASLSDTTGVLEAVQATRPHVVIMDVRMPPTFTDEGIRAALEIQKLCGDTAVLLLSQYVEPTYAEELVRDAPAGTGYLLKQRVGDFEEFLAALHRVRRGETALDSDIFKQFVGSPREKRATELLTPRERQVLELMATGLTNSGILNRLGISERAVEKHVTSILGKLRIPNSGENHRRVLAVLDYLRGMERLQDGVD
ncbi:response regulator transcription factor [Streptomyces sp. PKU-MA01144]|uniref:response regulator transcription factor n=1 Tax=Streptomyces TaxID=1883 RepID=UPI00148131D5|nr:MULTISPECIES: response regulator transcription factor [Streptomyces]MCY0983588.1 response regulator transcription factor [Streptomyces tirandamycinicus]NNJ08208.1 response regulator transcription factor [Streptomyces sp. PKU-MA01144]